MTPFPLPSSTPPHTSSSLGVVNDLTILLGDDRAIAALIDRLLDRANLSDDELAGRLGIRKSTLYQYRVGRRKRPSIQWLVKLVSACGGRIMIEYPTGPLVR